MHWTLPELLDLAQADYDALVTYLREAQDRRS